MALPNWATGAAEWAKGHRAQAAGIGVGVVVLMVFLFSGVEGPDAVDQGPVKDDLFSAGALPEDATTAGALQTMQARMTSLELDIGRQKDRDAQLELALRDQVAMLSTQMKDQERALHGPAGGGAGASDRVGSANGTASGSGGRGRPGRRRCRRCASCGRAAGLKERRRRELCTGQPAPVPDAGGPK